MRKMTIKSSRKQGKILSVGLNSTSTSSVLSFVRDSLARGYKFSISTPNPEIVLQAQDDLNLLKALEAADLAIPDGVGLTYAARFLGQPVINLIKGRELFIELIKLANKKGWKVFLLGGGTGVAKGAAINLRKNFKRVRIAFFQGPTINKEAQPETVEDISKEKDAIAQVNEFKPQLLFVAFGAPKQEKWVYNNLPKLDVGGAMVVGGTLAYIAGRAHLPPKWARKNFEWLWRLVSQPSRFPRILRATVVFPWKVFLSKVKKA
jgi:N-acetylglucosaminyldiphosphoundecaprenol N-acetyl-beta-D-mannosaminyltransferase